MTETPAERQNIEAKLAALNTLMSPLPNGIHDRINILQELSVSFRKRLAQELEPTLNDHLKTLNLEFASDRREAAEWVNKLLQDFGLCVTVRGHPALFIAEFDDFQQPPCSQFALLLPNGDRFTREAVSREAPYLSLDAAPMGIEEVLRQVRRLVYSGREH